MKKGKNHRFGKKNTKEKNYEIKKHNPKYYCYIDNIGYLGTRGGKIYSNSGGIRPAL